MEENKTDVSFNWGNILVVFIFLAVVVGGFIYFAANTTSQEEPRFDENELLDFDTLGLNQQTQGSENVQTEESEVIYMDTDQLQMEDIVVGTGEEAEPGRSATVHYEGTLTNGNKFDSSYDRGQPFTFNLGAGQVIQGWDIGVAGMKVGGKRKLIIPAQLGYGSQGTGGIPPNSTLIFTVELLGVE
jgi:FKBP-type peptidyl-prolyl cis-trans isomerase FkpA